MSIDDKRNIRFRYMREDDLELVMNWRMMPDITKYMNTDPKLTLEGQKKWFYEKKKNPDNYLFMIEEDDTPIGVFTIVDLDRVNNRCSSGLYIGEKSRRSLGLTMRLEYSIQDFIFYTLNLNRTTAEIFSENKGLIRINHMCGWEIEGVMKQHVYKNGVYHDITLLAVTKDRWEEYRKKCKYEQIPFLME